MVMDCDAPFATVPDCGPTLSQLVPSLVALVAFHCKGNTPGLLIVTPWGARLALPSTPEKESTAGVTCRTGACPGCSGVTCSLTGRVTDPVLDVKPIEAV